MIIRWLLLFSLGWSCYAEPAGVILKSTRVSSMFVIWGSGDGDLGGGYSKAIDPSGLFSGIINAVVDAVTEGRTSTVDWRRWLAAEFFSPPEVF